MSHGPCAFHLEDLAKQAIRSLTEHRHLSREIGAFELGRCIDANYLPKFSTLIMSYHSFV